MRPSNGGGQIKNISERNINAEDISLHPDYSIETVTSKVLFPVGFKIVRVNTETGVIRDFATNKGKRNGPASWLKSGGLERPLSVKFDRSGSNLYVVDFGIMKTDKIGTGNKCKPRPFFSQALPGATRPGNNAVV